MRRNVMLVCAATLLLLAVVSVNGATSYVARLGAHGAARWTLDTSVYVNLKAMATGTWKQQLWAGTCASPTQRVAVLPSLVVPSSRTLSKTTPVGKVRVTDSGVVLRLLLGSASVCGVFLAPLAAALPPSSLVTPTDSPSPSPSPTPTPSDTPASAPTDTPTAVPMPTPPTPAPTPSYMYSYRY
jgi:hypothetical protein